MILRSRPLLTVLLLFLSALPTTPQGPWSREAKAGGHSVDPIALAAYVDSTVPGMLKSTEVPGAIVVVVQYGHVIFSKGYGLADIETQRPMDPDTTVVRIASVSKPATAILALQLVAMGQIKLDQDVRPLLGSVRLQNPFPQAVTLRELLTHTAGLDEANLGRLTRQGFPPVSLEAYLRDNTPPVVRRPGDVLSYSNHGFALVGQIVASQRHLSFTEAAREYLFKPLKMASSSFEITPALRSKLATGYRSNDGKVEKIPLDNVNTIPASMMVTTGSDFAKLLSFMLSGDANSEVLDAVHLKEMRRIQFKNHDALSDGYGFGLFVENGSNGTDWVWHDGDMRGWSAEMDLYEPAEFGMFMAFNTDDGSAIAEKVRRDVREKYFGFTKLAPQAQRNFPTVSLRPFRGRWRYINEPVANREKIGGLFDPGILIEPTANDTLIFAGHTYVEIAPLVFQRTDDPLAVLAFKQNAEGGFYATTGIRAYRKMQWFEVPLLHHVVLAIAVLGLLTIALRLWPLLRKKHGPPIRGAYAVRWGLASIILLAFSTYLIGFVSVMSEAPVRYGLPSIVRLVFMPIAWFAILLSCLLPVAGMCRWRTAYTGRLERLHYILITVCAWALSCELLYWHQLR